MSSNGARLAIGFLVFLSPSLLATDPDRDFSGVWILDDQSSDVRGLPMAPGALLTISRQGSTIQATESDKARKSDVWIYHTGGEESTYHVRGARMNSMTKWEGSALLINTIVTGPQNYVVVDRWKISRDHNSLTIKRQIQRGAGVEAEAVLVYRNQHPVQADQPSVAPSTIQPATPPAAGTLSTIRPATPPPADYVVPAGTKIPLALVNSLSTKHSGEGDRVYLQTVFPITIDGHIIIPRGSYVTGTVTEVKRPGRVKGKGEMFLRFDSLTLPNGATRDFRSRLGGADADAGDLDHKEGKIRGEGNKAGDAGTVAKTTAAGTGVGAVAGRAASHTGMGAGIGAAAGAAAGLAAVLLSRGPALVLPKGTSFEMVLDRTLRFKPAEVEF
jgi:type F conjugative transfer system protein TrbI